MSCQQICSQNGSMKENFGDVFNSNKILLGKNIIKGDIGYSFSKINFNDKYGDNKEYYRNSMRINLNINPFGEFYFRNTLFIDLNILEEKPKWLSNYFYQIGLYNWENRSFSFGYENYQPNLWDGFFDKFFVNLKRGFFFVSYNYIITDNENNNKKITLFWDETSKIVFTPIIKIHPEYQNEFNELGGYLKPVLGTNIRYVIVKNIYIETGLFYYPLSDTKLPWDPDYTYGFGIFNWKAFKVNLTYGNWIINRFPWNDKEIDNYNFLNGEIVLNFTFSW